MSAKARYDTLVGVRVLITAIVYVAALVVVAAVAFAVVIVFAGPHASILPNWAAAIVLGLGWLAVGVLPVLVALKVWRRFGRTRTPAGL